MERISFENGVTKVNEDTFNEFQDNIEEACVYTGATEPETTEKVWIKKGENLLNPENLRADSNTTIAINSSNNPIVTQSETDTATDIQWTVFKKLNGSYVSAIKTVTNAGLETLDFKFTKDSSFDELAIGVNGSTKNTFVLYNVSNLINGNKYVLSYRITNNTQGSLTFDQIQLESGEDLNTFEPYAVDEILVKNKNNIFDELTMIESGSNTKGSWVKYPDGTMMCYGKANLPSGQQTVEITLPMPYIDDTYNVIPAPRYANIAYFFCAAGTKNTTTAVIYPRTKDGNVLSSTESCAWLTIGRWK